MGNVREIFELEKDPAMIAKLMSILNQVDPPGGSGGAGGVPGAAALRPSTGAV